MAQLPPASETRELTAAVQDYAKAIFTLETRDGAASTTDLAALTTGSSSCSSSRASA